MFLAISDNLPKRSLLSPLKLLCLAALAWLGCSTITWGAPGDTVEYDDAVQVEVVAVTVGGAAGTPVVVLRQPKTRRALPIFIGPFEATAIWRKLHDHDVPRPLTHDLMKSLLDASGVTMERIVITEIQENTYYARIYLHQRGSALMVDSRPSDAIALALRCDKPIWVSRELMHSAGSFDLSTLDEPVQFGGLTLQELTPELAAQLNAHQEAGVIVADVRSGRYKGHLRRGDILQGINGEPPLDALAAAIEFRRLKGASAVTLTVIRKGKHVTIHVP